MKYQKKIEERNTTLTNLFNDFPKNQTQQPQRGSLSQNRGQNSSSSRGNNPGTFRGCFRGNTRGFRGPRPNYPRPQWQNQNIRHDISNFFSSKIQIPFFSLCLPVSNLRIKTFKIKILRIKIHSLRIQFFNRNHRLNSLLQILITCLIHKTQITCHKCGYPNHLATNCTVRKNLPHRGAQNPFNQNSKN